MNSLRRFKGGQEVSGEQQGQDRVALSTCPASCSSVCPSSLFPSQGLALTCPRCPVSSPEVASDMGAWTWLPAGSAVGVGIHHLIHTHLPLFPLSSSP